MQAFIDKLSQLIATPSVSCTQAKLDMSNLPVINLLSNWLEDLGFDCRIMPVPNGDSQQAKANLIATLGKGPGGLVLSGHTDTVPCDPHLWQQDPFTLKIDNERAYGLGATDMKGFFATALMAIEPFVKQKLKAPIIILATADEETSMYGARELVKQGYPKARFAIVGEPTDRQPIRMHKGVMMEAIIVEGKSGHSSNPALGNNALEAMHSAMTALFALRSELQQRYQNPGFDIPIPTMNPGCIHGGDNPNRICGHCEFQFDVRLLPGMGIDDIRHEIDAALAPVALAHRIDIKRVPLFAGIDAFEQAADSTLVQITENLTGFSAGNVAYATEAPFLQALGMEVVVMGPGSIKQAHQPNEYIALDQIQPSVACLQSLIQQFCVEA